MGHWWLDHVLPGTISGTLAGVILSLPVWVHHRLMRRHISDVTNRQTEHLDELTARQSDWLGSLTAEQTAALTARKRLMRLRRRHV